VTYYLIGASFSDLKRPDRAVPFYEQAIQRNPRFAQALYGAGIAYAQLGRRNELEYTVQRLRPVSPTLADQLAKVQVAPPRAAAGGVPDLPTERLSPR
jgi:tetratricopeptide (TPR) repeat protein